MELDTSKWSGEGTFTERLIEGLRTLDAVALVQVEDAPASRSEADYNFISNEVFVIFAEEIVTEPVRRLGFIPASRKVPRKVMTLAELEQDMTKAEGIGEPDYGDAGMLQYPAAAAQ